MLRLRCEVAQNVSSVRLSCEIAGSRRWKSLQGNFRSVGPYGITIPLSSSSPMNRAWRQNAGTTLYTSSVPLACSCRFVRVGGKKDASGEADAKNSAEEPHQSEDSKQKEQDGAKKEEEKPASGGIFGIFSQLRQDMTQFPDIYNSINMLNFVLFTVFCLCSTGSNVESEWWLEHWGIDCAVRPWAWALHSFLTNNFLSMAFAMMMIHGMCTSVVTTVGYSGLMQYLAIVSLVSGVTMWAFNYARGYNKEKQFGPWDITAALFVMQYFHQGFKPWQILNSFSGWQKYAMWVGAFCIAYYDWQPVICGTALGLALVKFHPKFRAPLAAAA